MNSKHRDPDVWELRRRGDKMVQKGRSTLLLVSAAVLLLSTLSAPEAAGADDTQSCGTPPSQGVWTIKDDCTITGSPNVNGDVIVSASVTIAASGNLTVNSPGTLTVTNTGTITLNPPTGKWSPENPGGVLEVPSKLTNQGTINSSGLLIFAGVNSGTIKIADGFFYTGVFFYNSGKIAIESGTMDINGLFTPSYVINGDSATITNSGTLNNGGILINNGNGTITNTGTLENKGTIYGNVSGSAIQGPGTSIPGTFHVCTSLPTSGSIANDCLLVVTNSSAAATYTVNQGTSLNIPSDATLYIAPEVTLVIEGSITIDGSLNNRGTLINPGTTTVDGTIINNGFIQNSGAMTTRNKGAIQNNSTIESTKPIQGVSGNEVIINAQHCGKDPNFFESWTVQETCAIYSDQTFKNGVKINTGVTLYIRHGVTLTNEGTITIDGTLYNLGTLNNESGATISNTGNLTNDKEGVINNFAIMNGKISNSGTMIIKNGASISSTSAITNNEEAFIYNSGTLNGTINNSGTVVNTGTNNATITGPGTVINNPTRFELPSTKGAATAGTPASMR